MKTNREIASFVLQALKQAGAEDAHCIVASGVTDEFNVDGGEFSLMRSVFDQRVTMKAIKNKKMGVISINSFLEDAMTRVARECVESAEASMEDNAVCISGRTENRAFVSGIPEPDRDRFFGRLQEYLEDVKRAYPKILLEQVVASYVSSDSCFANTNGVEYQYRYGHYTLSTMFSAQDGDKSTSFNGCGISFDSLDSRMLDLGMQRDLYQKSEELLESAPYEGKFCGKAVFVPLCLRDLLSMALSNFAGETTILDGTSPWRDALGTKVASEDLTVSFAPLDARMVGCERYTNDGYVSENYDVLRDGVLQSFSLSEYAARKTGHARAKNTSSCMIVRPGRTPLEDIIAGIDRGILVYRFSGGMPAVNGDFSGVAKNSFLIENGKISKPVTETMISGNLAAMLKNLVALSGEAVCDGSSVLPWAAFDGITVSGK